MPLSTGRRPRGQVHGVGLHDHQVMLEVRRVLGKMSNEEGLIGVLQVVTFVGLEVRVLLGRILAVSLPVPDLAAVAAQRVLFCNSAMVTEYEPGRSGRSRFP